MPPKFKFTKDEIIAAALKIARRDGFDAVSARNVAAELSSSSKPLFSIFENMDELKKETVKAARAVYNEYIEEGLEETPAFKGVGKKYIEFAKKEPALFHLLFMTAQDNKTDSMSTLPIIDSNFDKILLSVQNAYGFDKANAERLYRHLWLYTHGIATLIATGVCNFSGDEISSMLTEVCMSLIKRISEEGLCAEP